MAGIKSNVQKIKYLFCFKQGNVTGDSDLKINVNYNSYKKNDAQNHTGQWGQDFSHSQS